MIQHPVPQSLLIHIGDMTVSFALLESHIQSLFGSLVREHQRIGQILSTYLSFSNLRAATISLYLERHGEDEDFATLKEFMNAAGKIEEERNRITHSIWAAGNTPDSISRIKMTAREKRGFHIDFEQYDEAKLIEFTNRIKELAERLLRFHLELLEKGKIINNPSVKMW